MEKLYHMMQEVWLGDCLDLMKNIPDNSVDTIICDLPYGTTACSWDSVIPLDSLWLEYFRIRKESANIILFSTQPFTTKLIYSNLNEYRYELVCIKNKKTGFLNAKKQPLRQYENIQVFYKKFKTYNPQKTVGHTPVNSFTKYKGDGETVGKTKIGFSGGGSTERYPTNLLEFSVVNNDNSGIEKKYHPTQKPIALLEYLIKTYSSENDLILDNCAGSGTTLLAAKNLNRQFIGIEKEDAHVDIIKKRLANSP